ncbi:ankyrin repeat protein [Ophiocordyceps camponoti-floridani]|uniref:Ankyrin repeat protein n=1 Tax=Ophiocordyceps camponoti-floridani TaxID=2030778 RepID=A0A8H4VCM7_9HYPO|nr:ankyrin repeat protein [Ophiocordyceps camponoti-floridani]
MAPDKYHQTCNHLYHQIWQRLEKRDDETLRFAKRGTSSQVLDEDALRRFMRSLELNDPPLTETLFAERVRERQLHDFLATLIFAACDADAAGNFLSKLVAASVWPVRDDLGEAMGTLPANRRQLEELFGNTVDADRFLSKQAYFCTVVLRKRDEVHVKNGDFQRLPYLQEKPLGWGSFGRVFKVTIAPGHFCDARSDTAFGYNTEPMEMARKDYITSDAFRAKDEYRVMKQILSSPTRTCDNIVESLGCLQIGSRYSLFMPLAICDLRDYILENHRAKPRTKQAKADIVRCAAGLAGGLHFLHEEMMTPDLERIVCYHMDLNPSNILIFREDKGHGLQNVWKLSDFGMSRVKVRRDFRGGNVKEKDFNNLFVRRVKPRDPSVSATLNMRGEGTYLAPESIAATPMMQASSDVWSLGCVISVIFTYLEEGGDGVVRFQEERAQHRNADSYDRFFLRGSMFKKSQVHPRVRAWHTELISNTKKRDANEGQAMAYVLRCLETGVLRIDPGGRWRAKGVKEMLEKAFQLYRGLGEHSAPAEHKPMTPPNPLVNMFKKVEPASEAVVSAWPVSPSDDFKGCVVSPDAAHVVYWTDIKIVLYTSQSLMHPHGQMLTPSAEFTLEETDCFWKNVCVSRGRLVAYTTGCNHCYLFNLEGGTAVDANLGEWWRTVLQLPEVHRLAISPDGSKLVCVAQHEDGGNQPGSLFYAAVSDLFPVRTRSRDLSSAGWNRLELGWSAADVVHLSVSDANDVYVVVRPEPTARSSEHKIPIMHVSLEGSTVDTLNIQSLGYDSSSIASFFTAFCPFWHEATCAVVTREKRFHVQKFAGTDIGREVQKDIPNYRVCRLLMGHCDSRLFALGTMSANHRMLLLEMRVPQPEADLEVRQVAHLPGLSYNDEFSEMLWDEGGEGYILIAALTRTVYRVAIPRAEPVSVSERG